MGYIDTETGETPEERRMRLLAEMGSPFLGRQADPTMGTVDSSGAFGLMPQGFSPQPDASALSMLGTPWLDPGQTPGGSGAAYQNPPDHTPWVDPGQTPGGSGTAYQDPPPRLGNMFTKPPEPAAPEQAGIMANGTRSVPGRGVLAQAMPDAAIPAGPIAAPADVNVQGANAQDRSNVPRSPDMPQTAAPPVAAGLPSMAGGLGSGAAASYAKASPQIAAAPAPSAATGDEEDTAPSAKTPSSPTLPQPQVAAAADGLSRKPGSPAAMTWLQDNADLFIALGAGLLSGRNIGEGIIQGLKLANDQKTTNAKLKQEAEKNMAENLQRAAHARVLQQAFPNMSSEQAIANSADADLVKRAQQMVYPDAKDPAWQRTTLPDGTPILENKETGDRKLDVQGDQAERPLTDPAERAKWGIQPDDKKAYTIKGNEAPKVIGGSGQTINVNTGQDKLVEIAADQFKGHLAAVDQARQTLQATASMRDQLNAPGGVITGAAAGDRLALQKVGSLLGVADPSAITNTESLRAAAGPLVLATVKGLGAGTGISNADRDFAAAMAGGNIELNESSIRRMIDIQEQAAREKMTRSQGVINQLIQTNPNLANMAPLLTAPLPEARPPAASQSAPPAQPAPPQARGVTREFTYDPKRKELR
jgi:phage tail protein X